MSPAMLVSSSKVTLLAVAWRMATFLGVGGNFEIVAASLSFILCISAFPFSCVPAISLNSFIFAVTSSKLFIFKSSTGILLLSSKGISLSLMP